MILCCGEALIDMLPRVTEAGETAFSPYVGGAVFNTAVALGRLGVPTEFYSGLSSDFFGQMLRDSLAQNHVGSRYAHISPQPTTLAFVRLVDGQASYIFYDENSAGRSLAPEHLPELDANVTALQFGAISLIPEPCGSTYEALMAREHAKRVIILDPNIRPGFIPDKEKHLARMRRMIAMSDIVKVSDEDLNWFGEVGSLEDVARRWLVEGDAIGPKLILLTHGADGATGYTKRQAVQVPGQRVAVVDTVGAGDTFTAGVLASLQENGALTKAGLAELTDRQIEAALTLGIKAATVTVSRAGANPPWRSELAA
ncbi:carbohydrate kinase [Phyllobacterium sp. 21LDTY02-6]|jgi:fructokinase|uniref:carbohydrate kinase family protein n=1 Tax=unclassified Phyllobacterium TaxID=2638441 RepID=UPI002020B4F4|nr:MULTISPECIES: carbohydrate kinase [unclassified Phyllobacterium]MCO4317829.1 carbohydrate kinase [Phyllobacterium sp. 21LDTY02-6]MCX8282011.1 carbohydrate kinase [Phyllobacterium sp. 0TCS1.6C]MCX8296297.1 carbohydrate kinase [Phyllobacterium sp. 0TCS1.6A]